MRFSLYFHIPYCTSKCPYCDFNTYAVSKVPEKDYVAALSSELDYYAAKGPWKGSSLESIYFGGGTPSLFKPHSIDAIIRRAREYFTFAPNIEITLEANPGSLFIDDAEELFDAGVNRISLGAQSFTETTLQTLGRMHSVEDIFAALSILEHAEFNNHSIDLMYGIPNQTLKELENDLREVLSLSPKHISVYGLTIEKGTPFFSSVKRGSLKLLPEKELVEMAELIHNILSAAHYNRYEISNYSVPGFEARHNMNYWNGSTYLGIGAGAHSFDSLTKTRWANFALPIEYMSQANAFGKAQAWNETLSLQDEMFEYFFLRLRKAEGINVHDFERLFSMPFKSVYGHILEVLTQEGLLTELFSGQYALSDKGFLLADSVIENFIPDTKELQSLAM